jgi:hypothetical protein
MKRLIIGFGVALWLAPHALAANPPPPKPKLFLFAGQSNMVGAGDRTTLTTEERQPLTTAFVYIADPSHAPPLPFPTTTPYTRFWLPPQGFFTNYNAWGYTPGDAWNAVNPGHYIAVINSYGPEFTTARDLANKLGEVVYVAKYALGGAGLDPAYAGISATWYPNASDPGTPAEYTLSLYHSMLCWATNALAAARQNQPETEIAGFFWLQGEADAIDSGTASLYRTNFTKFLQRIRGDFGKSNLPVVFARITNLSPMMPYALTVRTGQAAVAAADTNAAMVITDDLPLDTTYKIHFTDAGLKTVGQRFAQAWLNLNRPPLVTNGYGATNVLCTAARLTGSLVATGGVPTQVSICWGPADGGADITSWSNRFSLGTLSAGPFSAVIDGLAAGSNYFYRCLAQNAFGDAWANSTVSFTTLAPGADNNHDGLPDAWQIYYFGSTNAPNSGPGDDPDHDGASNLAEFIAGTGPTNAADRLVLAVRRADNDVVLSFPALAAVGAGYEGKTRQYTLVVSTNLAAGGWQALPGWINLAGDDSNKACTNHAAGAAAFYRLRVELPAITGKLRP